MDSKNLGPEWLRTTLYSIGDAVITTGVDGRIREMNPIAEALTGWSEAEAAGQAFADVFVALDEDSRQRVGDPASAALRDGDRIGLANHTLLVARDGQERPIANSGAPIRDARGSLMGSVIVFRDQTEERAQIRALEESERRHRELFESNPQAMWIYDEESLAFLDVNAAAVARYRYSRDEFLGMTLADIRSLEDVPALRADASAVPAGFEGGRRWRHRRKDGSEMTVEIASHPVPWPSRRARVVLAHDVTAQAALEARLHWQAKMLTRLASREPLQSLLNELVTVVCSLCPGAMSSVMLLDADGRALRPVASHGVPDDVQAATSPTPVADLAGVCGTAAMRRKVFVVEDIESDPAFAGYRELAERHGLRAAWSCPFFDAHGRLLGTAAMYWRESRPPTVAELEVTAFAAALAGVMVERSRDLDALTERESKLRLIFENEPECVKVLDPEGRLLDMNPAGLRLIEAESLDQVQGASVGDLVTPAFRQQFTALTRDAVRGGGGVLEFELTGLKGTHRWLETHVAPLRDAQERIIAVLGITRDVSERKALAAQLLQAQKLESVGRLAGGVAHDFNNMLSVIQGQTELALQEVEPGSPLAAGLSEVLKAAERSALLTRQLLTFARRDPSSPRALDLNGRIQELVEMLSRLIGAGVSVVWQPGSGVWPVRIDPGQFDQVLTNLVVNARDAMDGFGTLTITTANTTRGAQETLAAGDYVVMTVSDTGTGMDADTLTRMFEPFFTTKPLGQGTGLGLAMVYGIARQHDGVVEAASSPGQGATFKVFLPRCLEDGAAGSAAAAPRLTAVGGKGTILVVEDEPALLGLICRVLRSDGYDVLDARSPHEAEALVGSHDGPLHLLLTDMVMPGTSGRDLWRRVRGVRTGLRCVIMSGYSHEVIDDAGARDVPMLKKPFSMAALVETVRRALDTGAGTGDPRGGVAGTTP